MSEKQSASSKRAIQSKRNEKTKGRAVSNRNPFIESNPCASQPLPPRRPGTGMACGPPPPNVSTEAPSCRPTGHTFCAPRQWCIHPFRQNAPAPPPDPMRGFAPRERRLVAISPSVCRHGLTPPLVGHHEAPDSNASPRLFRYSSLPVVASRVARPVPVV